MIATSAVLSMGGIGLLMAAWMRRGTAGRVSMRLADVELPIAAWMRRGTAGRAGMRLADVELQARTDPGRSEDELPALPASNRSVRLSRARVADGLAGPASGKAGSELAADADAQAADTELLGRGSGTPRWLLAVKAALRDAAAGVAG